MPATIVNGIPHCIHTISQPDLKEGGIANFIDAADKLAGKPVEPRRQYPFSNAWVYNTIEAACVALMIDPQGDQEILEAQVSMREALEDWIPKILAAQEPDGYLQTAFTLNGNERWSPQHRGDHEGYVAGYFLDAAVAHYLMTHGADERLPQPPGTGGLLGQEHRPAPQKALVRWPSGPGNGAGTIRTPGESGRRRGAGRSLRGAGKIPLGQPP
jgi:hypothetical protein